MSAANGKVTINLVDHDGRIIKNPLGEYEVSPEILAAIRANPRFQQLTRRRARLTWTVAALAAVRRSCVIRSSVRATVTPPHCL